MRGIHLNAAFHLGAAIIISDDKTVINGVDLQGSHGNLHDNYVHDLQSWSVNGAIVHTDRFISDGNDTLGLVLRHNTLLNQMTTEQGASAAVGLFADAGPVTNSTVVDNWIAGGAYALHG